MTYSCQNKCFILAKLSRRHDGESEFRPRLYETTGSAYRHDHREIEKGLGV